jgi:hypothetical protein
MKDYENENPKTRLVTPHRQRTKHTTKKKCINASFGVNIAPAVSHNREIGKLYGSNSLQLRVVMNPTEMCDARFASVLIPKLPNLCIANILLAKQREIKTCCILVRFGRTEGE